MVMWRRADGSSGGGGAGKYGIPGAGVIIYLAPEIGPADTAGRFNGRTMLELTKTKTKHQLGDFFFHFSFASASLFSLSFSIAFTLPPAPTISLFLSVSVTRFSLRSCQRRREATKVRILYVA